MKITQKIYIIFLLPFFSGEASPAAGDTVRYSRDFTFKEGVYLTFTGFRDNSPLPKATIISDLDKNSPDFFSNLVSKKSILYRDSLGQEQKAETRSIWGFCQNGTVYILFNNDFNRMGVIGSLCHFVSVFESYAGGYYDPYAGAMRNTIQELRQYILDMQTGRVVDFGVNNMEILLTRDEALHAEFMALSKRKKKDSVFLFLRKYNEKHPLFFYGQ